MLLLYMHCDIELLSCKFFQPVIDASFRVSQDFLQTLVKLCHCYCGNLGTLCKLEGLKLRSNAGYVHNVDALGDNLVQYLHPSFNLNTPPKSQIALKKGHKVALKSCDLTAVLF